MKLGFVTVQTQLPGLDFSRNAISFGALREDGATKFYSEPMIPKLIGDLSNLDAVIGIALESYTYPMLRQYRRLPEVLPSFDLIAMAAQDVGYRIKFSTMARAVGHTRLLEGMKPQELWRSRDWKTLRQGLMKDLEAMEAVWTVGNAEGKMRLEYGNDVKVIITDYWSRYIEDIAKPLKLRRYILAKCKSSVTGVPRSELPDSPLVEGMIRCHELGSYVDPNGVRKVYIPNLDLPF